MTSRSSTLLAPFAPTNKKDPAAIRVYVLRQVSIKVNTIDLWRSYVLAEGSLTYVPHSLEDGIWLKNVASIPKKAASVHSGDSVGSSSEKEGWATHEWSGELKIDRNQANVGGFAFGDMIVKVSFLRSLQKLLTFFRTSSFFRLYLQTRVWAISWK